MLDRIVNEKLLRASCVYAHLPSNSSGDCIEVYKDESRSEVLHSFPMMRQQRDPRGERGCRSLADFVAPKESEIRDYVGFFALTAGLGLDELTAELRAQNDDFQAILAAALADRLAEAFSGILHERVAGEGVGIRPAPGYPACPDHRLKSDIFEVLQAEKRIGLSLTESWSMMPASSISGFYFSHPEAIYFGVGSIGEDQLAWLAEQRGLDLQEAARSIGSTAGGSPPVETVSSPAN